MTTAYIVKHKNPVVPATAGGTAWATDGLGLGWTKEQAEAHAARCEFAVHGIPFEVALAEPPVAKKLRDVKPPETSTT